jgi:NAD(P)-dependent dehydrogenase (short-subunit alcohol dehydrogenase family)
MGGKVVLLTGSSRGIGRATAIALAQQGHKVYATMRRPSASTDFTDVSEEIRQNIFIKPLDVQDKGSIESAVSEILDKENRLDVAINNAGYALFGPIEMVTDEEVYQQFDVNVFGVIRVIRAVLPQMRRQKSGHIINISSIAGIVGNPGLGVYCATKHAIEALSSSLAATVYPWNIKVSVIEPGSTNTEFCELMTVGSKLRKENPYSNFCGRYRERMVNILKEGQPPEEIAELIGSIINRENPDFRYQSSPRLKEVAKQFVTDPSGNAWITDQKEKFGNWFHSDE